MESRHGPPDVRLLAIFDPAAWGVRALDVARAAEAGGATILQVRMKDSAAGETLWWTERLVAALGIPVWVNDRADIAWLAGAAGVHLGAEDLPIERVRAAAAPLLGIGVSVGTDREAEAARRARADYWSIGSIYVTPSKADAGTPIGVQGFRDLAARAPVGTPCIAIGGVTAARVPELRAAGATGVAAIGAIFAATDVERAARALRDAVDATPTPG
jgi:thiamine-phosphate pyrophosphorylase